MQNPYTEESSEQTEAHFRLAVALLSKFQIPPSPLNYRLAYEYVLGNNEELKTVLDNCIGHSEPVSQEILWEIYQHYFIHDLPELEKMRQELQYLIVNIQNEFKRSGGELLGFSNRLDKFSHVLRSERNKQEISSEVQRMIKGTDSVAKSQRTFDAQMLGVMDEMELLRKEIQQIKEESLTDALTGIANRRAFDNVLEKFIQSTVEGNLPLSLLLIDVDHFKKFNDTFGHLIGDKVLRFLGATLMHCIKGQDFAARYGGEEFAVILPNTSHVGAKVIAEFIRKAISATELQDEEKSKNYGQITASIGVSEYRPEESSNVFIQRCDEGLYQAKVRGRNQVVVI